MEKGAQYYSGLGDAKGGFLCTNNGQRALLRLLKELIAFFEERDHIKAFCMRVLTIGRGEDTAFPFQPPCFTQMALE